MHRITLLWLTILLASVAAGQESMLVVIPDDSGDTPLENADILALSLNFSNPEAVRFGLELAEPPVPIASANGTPEYLISFQFKDQNGRSIYPAPQDHFHFGLQLELIGVSQWQFHWVSLPKYSDEPLIFLQTVEGQVQGNTIYWEMPRTSEHLKIPAGYGASGYEIYHLQAAVNVPSRTYGVDLVPNNGVRTSVSFPAPPDHHALWYNWTDYPNQFNRQVTKPVWEYHNFSFANLPTNYTLNIESTNTGDIEINMTNAGGETNTTWSPLTEFYEEIRGGDARRELQIRLTEYTGTFSVSIDPIPDPIKVDPIEPEIPNVSESPSEPESPDQNIEYSPDSNTDTQDQESPAIFLPAAILALAWMQRKRR